MGTDADLEKFQLLLTCDGCGIDLLQHGRKPGHEMLPGLVRGGVDGHWTVVQGLAQSPHKHENMGSNPEWVPFF